MADKIEQQILNAERAIDKLNTKIRNLKSELQSGDWGTGQISQMQAQLNKLTTTLEKRTARRESLIDQKNVQEIERINKTITSIKANLEGLYRDKRQVGSTLSGQMSDDFKAIETAIKRQETALKSFQSRLAARQLQPSGGHTFTPEQTPVGGINQRNLPIETPNKDDIERRLNKSILGMPLTNAEVQDRVRKARELALDVMYGKVGQVGTERQVGIEIPEVRRPGDAVHTPVGSSVAKQLEAALGGQTKQTERAAKAAAAAAAEEKLLADLRNRIATDPKFRQYMDQLRARGLNENDIYSATSRGGGITQVSAARNQGGVLNKFQGYVNERTGTSTPGLSSQFRTFGGDILRDIGQFTKWSIAIAAVYTPMQKLGELMEIMVDNESRLADAAIAANVPFERSGEIFDEVAQSANQAGEGINTTIDAYTQAIRAAGRYNTEQEKSQKGLALLNDSLILSKLSTLDQATAIDTLSAALLQSDRELDQGQELLNKWVRTSQIANVSIDGLATGVAVLGDTAETVGLSVDQLNGLIAVLSENSIAGSKEAANAAKALVGAYQSDQAEAALNKFGVSLRRTNGEVRGFLEIYQELASLQKQGILSPESVSELALALGGGGSRRAAQATALITGQERLNQVAEESAKITGEDTLANDALAKKLETVETANTRLANSFQELAQTLGDDGGILDGFKSMIDLLTGLTNATNELFTVLGRSGPILATFVTGLAAMNAFYGVGGRKDVALARLGAGQFGGFLGTGGGQFAAQRSNAFGGGILADVLRMNYRGAGVIGAAGVGLQAASNVQAGKLDNAGANIVGGAIGGAIGAYLGGPAGLAIGSNVGSAVGDAFINAIFEHSRDLQDYLLPKNLRPETTAEDTPTQVELDDKSLAELLDLASKEAGIGGNLKAFFAASVGPGFGAYGGKKESALLDVIRSSSPEIYNEIMQRNAQQQADEAKRLAEANLTVAGGGAEFDQRRRQNEELASKARQEQLNRLATGQITSAEFGRISSQLAGFPSASIKSIENFGDELGKVSDELNTATEAYDAFLYISTYGTQDQINNISRYSDDILKLDGYLSTLEENPAIIGTEFELSWGKVKIESPEQLEKLISDAQKAGSTAFGITLRQVQESQGQAVKLPPLVGDYNKPLTGQGQDAAVRRGLDIQEQYLVETGKTAEEIAKFKQAIEEFYTAVDRGLGTAFEPVEGLTQQFYDLGKAAAEAAGELESLKGFGLQEFDVDRGTLERLAQQSVQIGSSWAEQFPGFETKPEDLLAITNDGLAKPIHADFRILALLLEKIVDQNQKQLDGQYNIPEGATFWVPLTAAYYRNKGGGGGDALQSALDSLAVETNTSATDRNTNAIDRFSERFMMKNQPDEFRRRAADAMDLSRGRSADAQRLQAQADRYNTDRGRAADAARYTGLAGLYGVATKSDERLPGGTPTFRDTGMAQLLSELRNILRNLFSTQPGPAYGGSYDPRVGGAGGKPGGGGVNQGTSVNTTPTTKLDLQVSSNINLMVDGRILAQTLQSYLASELLRTEQTQGTITRRFIA